MLKFGLGSFFSLFLKGLEVDSQKNPVKHRVDTQEGDAASFYTGIPPVLP